MKMRIVCASLILTHLICIAEERPGQTDKRTWGRSYHRTALPDGKDTRLELDGVSQGREHLVGEFLLIRQRTGTQLMIQGHIDRIGGFAPNVCLEVSDQEDGNWKSIQSTFSDKIDVTLMVASHIEHLSTRIQLDAFQPYIDKFKFCRVSLQTGESDVFPMAWLTEQGHP